MANTLLTPSVITAKALQILHQKLNFIGSINRTYDSQFANSGGKIGATVNIRLPNQFTTSTGPNLNVQDIGEQSIPLTISTQRHVDFTFPTSDLTLIVDDFATRYIEPAMAVLAASMESDAFNMALDVYNQVNGQGSAQTFRNVLLGRKLLTDNLAPQDDNRHVRLNTQDNVDLVDSLKGLFQDSTQVARQYREGYMGRTAGFDFAENTFLSTYTRGAANTGYLVNGASQTGSTLAVNTGTGAMNKGDVFTIAGVFRVHPETKISTGVLQQFVVTSAYAGGAGNVLISPAIVVTGARQNVSASPAAGAQITFAGTASQTNGLSLAYHRDAFAFASVDLEDVSSYGAWGARKNYDGISMRMARQYAIGTDTTPCRIDVLYGYATIRAQLAARLIAN